MGRSVSYPTGSVVAFRLLDDGEEDDIDWVAANWAERRDPRRQGRLPLPRKWFGRRQRQH